MNHLHKFYLVEAERHRVQGSEVVAMDYYKKAIALAKKHEYISDCLLSACAAILQIKLLKFINGAALNPIRTKNALAQILKSLNISSISNLPL